MEIHREAIEMVLDKAAYDNYYKYAIYTSRTLMVKHPEIYLKADALFLETIQTNPGFQKSYKITTVNDRYLLGNEMEGPPFSFDLVDFSTYRTIKASEIYPEGYPVLPYVDRRLLTMTVTLKPAGNRVTHLSKAEQYYFMLKEKGEDLSSTFLVYCDNENAYLYHQGRLISAVTLIETGEIEGNPILIFNEDHVWYPLMERDDTGKNAALRTIVERHATSVVFPPLTEFEETLVTRFVKTTELSSSQRNIALIAASRNWNQERFQSNNRPFREIWNTSGIQGILQTSNPRITIMHSLINHSNYLSPITTYLAAICEESEGVKKIQNMCREYLQHASAPEYGGKIAHGHIWVCGIMECNVEDSYYAYGGCCTTQAANMKAALDIAGIESYWIHVMFKDPPVYYGHSHIYIPILDLVVDNGKINRVTYQRSVLCEEDSRKRQCITFLSARDKWANFNPIEQYCGTLSPLESIEIFEYLASIHGDEFKGITYDFASVPSADFMNCLKNYQSSWRPVVLP